MTENTLLKNIRLRLGLTQKDLAKLLDVSQGAVSHWEGGYSYPSVTIADKFSKIAAKKGIVFTSKHIRGEE